MNLLTRRGTAVTFSDLPSRQRVLSNQELKDIMGARVCRGLREPCEFTHQCICGRCDSCSCTEATA